MKKVLIIFLIVFCFPFTVFAEPNYDGTKTILSISNTSENDVSLNSQGQITGTTEASDTGVETYFIVLFVLVVLSYGVLILSKRRNFFKNI